MKKYMIWFLDDAYYSGRRVPDLLSKYIPAAEVQLFTTRLEMEAAWQAGYRPDAVILDLLVPEKHLWFARLLQTSQKTGLRGIMGRLAVSVIALIVKPLIPHYLSTLQGKRLKNCCTYWGGVEFLRTRVERDDLHGVRVYIYSITAQPAIADRGGFGEICKTVTRLVEYLIVQAKQPIPIFAKGYFPGLFADKFVEDHLCDLISQMKQDFQIA